MIVTKHRHGFLILSQRDHAQISADLAEAMPLPPFDQHGLRQDLLDAIRHHDDGWQEWDLAAPIDPVLARPRSFNEMDRDHALPIWTKSIDAARIFGALPALTVAGHFQRLSELGEQDAATQDWQHQLLKRCKDWHDEFLATNPAVDDTNGQSLIETATLWLRFFDALSLNLCRGPTSKPFPLQTPAGKSIELTWRSEPDVRIDPWPFHSPTLNLNLQAKFFADGHIDDAPVTLNWHVQPASPDR